MNLRSGLLATTIALGALAGAANGPAGLNTSFKSSEPLYVSLEPVFGKTHTIKSGENDWTIAKKYGISVEALHKANPGTNWRTLQIGDTLTIPTGGSSTTKASSNGGTHTVKSGENDNTIAKKYGVTVAQIHSANPGVDWRKLQVGQKIKLPGGAEDTSNIRTISTSKVKITASAANVRTEPTTSSKVRTTVDKGTIATVLDRQGAWYELRFSRGTTGWIRGDLLTAVAEKPASSSSSASKTENIAAAKPTNMDKAESLIADAKAQLGIRYKWGGTSRGGFDCSGFMTYVFSHNGISLPRTSIEQSKIGDRVSKEDLEPGDLLFFVTGRSSSRINHVGMYIGDGKFIHASSSKRQVVVTKLSDYSRQYAGARRVPQLQIKELIDPKPTEKDGEKEVEVSMEELFPSRVVYGADKTGK